MAAHCSHGHDYLYIAPAKIDWQGVISTDVADSRSADVSAVAWLGAAAARMQMETKKTKALKSLLSHASI